MGNIVQIYFEFHEWEEAFKTWEDNLPIYGDNMQMVLSTNRWTSGYWIETKGTELADGDHLYTGDQVIQLENRIRSEMDLAKKENRAPKFII